MDERGLRGMLGISVRAGKASFGMDGCLKAVREKTAGVLVADEALSGPSLEKYGRACREHGVPLVLAPEGLVAEATGRPAMAVAVTDAGLAKQVLTRAGGTDPQDTIIRK